MADTMLPAEVADMTRLASPTLTGDVRDQILEYLKTRDGRPWAMLSEEEQSVQVQQAEHFGRLMVEKVVQVVAAKGQKSIKVELKNVGKGDSKIKLTMEIPVYTDEAWMMLGHNSWFEIIAADPNVHAGQKKVGAAHVEPQQGTLMPPDEAEVTDQKPAAPAAKTEAPAPEPVAEPVSEPKKLKAAQIKQLAAFVVKRIELTEADPGMAIDQALSAKDLIASDADRAKILAKAKESHPHLFDESDPTATPPADGDGDLGDDL